MAVDKTLACRDCGQSFMFTAGEQEFFAQKGFTNEPTRCPSCRSARKSSQGGGGGYSAGGGSFERRDRQMYSAVCAECGKEAQVPFEPRGDKPVYCSSCFESRRSSSYGDSGNSRGGRSRW
jgi:CxxC-x17-CxxC domain-containing protein